MAKEIVWTKRAERKLLTIVEHVESEFGYATATQFVKRTFEVVDIVSEHSDIGTLENPEKSIRGFLLSKHNRLFYRIDGEQIVILNFFDTRSGPKRLKF